MVITYHGGHFFKLQFGDTTIAIDPIGKGSKLEATRFGADIALSSINHPDFSGFEQVTFSGKKPFVVNGPGEYEVSGIFIKGLPSSSSYEGEKRVNTIYTFALDGIDLCFLGPLDSATLPQETKEEIDEVDILFTSIAEGALGPAEAYKLAVALGPKLIIPAGYDASKDSLKQFLKEAGEDPKPVDKLTIKKKDLEGKEDDVVVLSRV